MRLCSRTQQLHAIMRHNYAGNKLRLPFCGAGSLVYSCSTIGLAYSRKFLMSSLGLPFCGAGSLVYGCSTIGLAHSRNLLVSALRITFSNRYAQSVPHA